MKMTLLFLVATLSLSAFANSQTVLEETLYFDFQKSILEPGTQKKKLTGFSHFEQGLYVDALWDLVEENSPEAKSALDNLSTFHYSLYEKLRVGILRIKYRNAPGLPADLVGELELILRDEKPEVRIIYTIAAYEAELLAAGHQGLVDIARTHSSYFDVAEDAERRKELSKDVISDIFYRSPDVTTYMNGEYVKSVKIFMFCRTNRLHPCLMVMRDAYGEAVRNNDGTLWTHPSLASSSRGLPSYVRNGDTPAGIFTIDSVMPTADQQQSFGKFRRMILNFVPKAKNETHLKALLPETSHDEEWWRPTVAARDMGRNLFRIHGTGKLNNDPTVPYFPFMRTSGCVAQRENTYDGVTFSDQRVLLDRVMRAMDLQPVYANETKVKGLLYIVEVDDADEAVSEATLRSFGIE